MVGDHFSLTNKNVTPCSLYVGGDEGGVLVALKYKPLNFCCKNFNIVFKKYM